MKKIFTRVGNNMIRPLLIDVTTIISFSLFAQQINVSFKIVTTKKEPVPYASFTVIKRADTVQIEKKVADSSGSVRFYLTKNTQYIVRISSTNYRPVEKGITVTPDHTSFSFVTESSAKTMQGVVVTSKAPLMKQEDDKTIIDPEPIAAASTNAYEILE